MERFTESVLQSISPRLRTILEAGIRAGTPWSGDESCSPAVVVPLSVVEMLLDGGLQEFLQMLEGPTDEGRYYKVEDPWSPVLIAEVAEGSNSLTVYASDAPSRWLGSDPREAMIEDGGWTAEGWSELDEYSGIVDGRAKTEGGEAFPEGFMDSLLDWVTRYAMKGSLVKGEPKDNYADLVIPVYSMAQLDLTDIGKRFGVDIEIGLFDANIGLRWHPLGEVCSMVESLSSATKQKIIDVVAHDEMEPEEFRTHMRSLGIDPHEAEEVVYAYVRKSVKRGTRIDEWTDQLPGGKADKRKPTDFDPEQLAKGVKVELEHTDNIEIALEIAMDHLVEDPKYYDKLATIHKDEVDSQMAMIDAHLENQNYSESCGVFIPVPKRLHGSFPPRPEDDQSDPHITVCYLGDLTEEQYSLAAQVLSKVCQGVQPFVVEMTDYGEFTAAKGAKIAHMTPRSVGGPPFEVLHEQMVQAFRQAGIPVNHHRDGAFKPHISLAYLEADESYDGQRPQGYWRCEQLELWGAGVWLRGKFGNTQITLGSGFCNLAETGGVGGAGALSKTSRARVIRPVAGYGDGAATRAHGGFRFQIGHNRRRKPNKNVRLSIQNRKNAQRGLATRIKAAKDWHASLKGRSYHRDLARYNTGNHKGSQVVQPYSGALAEEYAKVVQNLDDAFDAMVRKLIRIESLDILQDADFDEDTGAIYMYFDPLMTRDEMELVLAILKEENSMAALVGSPERELPGEMLRADWWVVWAPYREANDGQTLIPDPRYYAADPRDRSKGAPAPQTFIKPAMTSVDQIGAEIDVDQLVQSINKEAGPNESGPVMMFWSDANRRTPQLKGMVSGAARAMLPELVESSALGRGELFLIRAHNAQEAREVIANGDLGRVGPAWTNDRGMMQ